ncbi:MAG: P1 family peptidase [Actinomycetota bacterium]|nr:MAG: P1 family peptidase [Actinomycetota bacterium]
MASREGTGYLTDVPGVSVGHHQRCGRGWRTGTTVVLTPDGATGGVDVRGGGPGTRETDLLRPENLVQHVDGICLSGGSAYGLAAADGVVAHLATAGIGFSVGPDPAWVVPIVPAAVIFDLGRGGRFDARPDATFGLRAARRASRGPERVGAVGAGTGAVAGKLQGGVGSASATLADGTVVAALAVVNAAGAVIDPDSGLPWAAGGLGLRRPTRAERRELSDHLAAAGQAAAAQLNTTIGVVATSARLTKAECTKVAAVAHDGLARAIRPAHSLHDGDTVFALATGHGELTVPDTEAVYRSGKGRPALVDEVLAAGADVFERACALAVVTARRLPGGPPAYADLCPSALAPWLARR